MKKLFSLGLALLATLSLHAASTIAPVTSSGGGMSFSAISNLINNILISSNGVGGGSTNWLTDANGNGYGVNFFALKERNGIAVLKLWSPTTTNGGNSSIEIYGGAAGAPFKITGDQYINGSLGIGTQPSVAANMDAPGTIAAGTVRATNFTLAGTGPSKIAVQILTNVTGQIFDACLPSITQSNLLITPATNMYVWYGPTNANLTNFVTLAVGKVSSPIVVQINNTNGSSCTVLLPSQGAANGAFFSTNGLPSDFATAPPGTNSAYAFRISGTNVICSVTRWKL